MSASLVFWIVTAVLLFWALGAYNRLVRLRAQVIGAFAPVDVHLGRALLLLAEASGAGEGAAGDAAPAGRAGLQGAAMQFDASLRVARRQPLDANAVAALRTAYATVHAVWELLHGDPDAGAQAPNQRAWEDNANMAHQAMAGFNQAVLAYNAAIAQFPAAVLAYLFSFGAAQCL